MKPSSYQGSYHKKKGQWEKEREEEEEEEGRESGGEDGANRIELDLPQSIWSSCACHEQIQGDVCDAWKISFHLSPLRLPDAAPHCSNGPNWMIICCRRHITHDSVDVTRQIKTDRWLKEFNTKILSLCASISTLSVYTNYAIYHTAWRILIPQRTERLT